jgi:hypothetical protein
VSAFAKWAAWLSRGDDRCTLGAGEMAELASLLEAAEGLRVALDAPRAAHQAEAEGVNFSRCGCDYCAAIRAADAAGKERV